MVSKKTYAYTTGTLGDATATLSYTYDGYDRLTNTGYVYDNLGNPTSYNGKTLTWKGNSLNSFAKSGITYALGYDWQRLLHCKTYTKNSKEIKEYYYYDGTRRTYDEIYYGNEVYPTALSYAYNKLGIAGFYLYDSQGGNTGSYTYRKNLFGDITAIYQGSTCVAKYKYDAWGNCTVCNPDGTTNASDSFIGNINPFRYRGYYWDKDLQLYYLQTRWYDPAIGRFISPDSIEYLDPESFGGLNLYAYCLNNPIMYVDPSGHVPGLVLALLIAGGLAIGFGGTALADYLDDGTTFNGSISTESYVANTLVMGLFGLFASIVGPSSFTLSYPTLTLMQTTMGTTMLVAGTGTVVVSGGTVVIGAGALLGGLVLFSKKSKKTGKETSSEKPSWVNEGMIDPTSPAQQNATRILNNKYGPGNWIKGPRSEFNQIVKWIERWLRYYRGW